MNDSNESSETPLFPHLSGVTGLSGEELQQLFLQQEVAKSNALRLRYLVVTLWIALAGLAYFAGQLVGPGSTYRNGIQQIHQYEMEAAQRSAFPFKIERQ